MKKEELLDSQEATVVEEPEAEPSNEKPKFKVARAEFGGESSGPDNDQNQP